VLEIFSPTDAFVQLLPGIPVRDAPVWIAPLESKPCASLCCFHLPTISLDFHCNEAVRTMKNETIRESFSAHSLSGKLSNTEKSIEGALAIICLSGTIMWCDCKNWEGQILVRALVLFLSWRWAMYSLR
jgi:hypothetical protein